MQVTMPRALDGATVNALSVDVEGFVESNVQSFPIPEHYPRSASHEVEANVVRLLEIFDAAQVRATFFFLGSVAEDNPGLVRRVADQGHEIGSHNFAHVRVFGLSPDEFKKNLASSKALLEDLTGQQVRGFRAPDFSITQSSLWALDILKDLEFLYDSSIYPVGLHDVYGIAGATPHIHQLPNGLIEFPLSTVTVLGRRLPFGGGGYFRLYPLALTKFLMTRTNRQGQPCMFYIHPYEAGPVVPVIGELTPYRRFRHYFHCQGGDNRLAKILKSFEFTSVINVLQKMELV